MRALFNRVLLHYDKVMFDLSGYLVDLKKSHLFMLDIESNQAIALREYDIKIQKYESIRSLLLKD
jgi:hypothetical protein